MLSFLDTTSNVLSSYSTVNLHTSSKVNLQKCKSDFPGRPPEAISRTWGPQDQVGLQITLVPTCPYCISSQSFKDSHCTCTKILTSYNGHKGLKLPSHLEQTEFPQDSQNYIFLPTLTLYLPLESGL